MRWLCLGLGILCAVMGLHSISDLRELEQPMQILPMVVGSIGLAALFFFLFYKDIQGEKEAKKFFAWLERNAGDVMNGGANYQGTAITPNTEMRQYLLTVSVLVATFKNPSRYYIAGVDNLLLANAGHSIGTLLLGWWGIPWGPIYSIQSLFHNLGGATHVTIGQILTRSKYN